MAASIAAGRNMLVKKNSTTIMGVRVVSWEEASTPIDITNADDAGYETDMSVSARRVLTITVAGIAKDGVLSGVALGSGSQLLTDITLVDPSQDTTADTISGNFFLMNYKNNGPFEEAIDFSATLKSSGAFAAG